MMNDLTLKQSTGGLAAGMEAFEKAYERLLHARPGVLASESGGELAWLKKARERDAAHWRIEGLPTRRQERWKYTNLSSIAESHIVLAGDINAAALPSRSTYPTYGGEAAAEIVFLNGHFVATWSKLDAGEGVSVVVLSELFEECVNDGWTPERKARFKEFRQHVEESDADRENVFAAMNTSFMQDGVLIHVVKGVRLEKPIVVTYLTDSDAEGRDLMMMTPRVFAHLEPHSEAALVEYYASGTQDGRYFNNAVSDLRLEDGARLSHCRVQSESETGIQIGTTRVHQKRDSWCETFQFSLGAKLSRQNLHISLEGPGAEVVLDGLYMVAGQQHVDHFTCVDHVVGHTTSDQTYKGILDGESHAAFNGRVWIHRDAQKSAAAQMNNNLVLSRKAQADTKPELEIDADDVKGAHGATIGQIDPEHVFYLQARAIPKREAVKMLARGFAQDIVFKMKNEAIRSCVGTLVDERFEAMHIGEAGEK